MPTGLLYSIGFGLLAAGVAGGFYCGWVYRGAQLPAPAPPAAAAPSLRGGFAGRPLVAGRVVSARGDTIVVHDGATDTDVKVVLPPGVSVTRTQAVSVKLSALTGADTLLVAGQEQADGSVRASAVSVSTGQPGFRTVRPTPGG